MIWVLVMLAVWAGAFAVGWYHPEIIQWLRSL